MNVELRTALDRVARRIRSARRFSGLAACWLVWGGLVAALTALGPQPIAVVVELAALAALSGLVCAGFAARSARDPLDVARRIEASRPELNAGLLTAVEGELKARPSDRRGFLQQTVIDQAIEHGRTHDWAESVTSQARVAGARFAHAAAVCALSAAFGAMVVRSSRAPSPAAPASAGITPADVQVIPGDAEIERGSALLVVARFGGAAPPEARLVVESGPAGPAPRAMFRSLDDPTFAGRVESVDADLSYRVEFVGRKTRTYRVHVFETPELTRADAKLVYPAYTSLEPKSIEDVRHVTAVEGTDLSLLLRLNKDVDSAVLVDERGEETALAAAEDVTAGYRAAFKLADSRRYTLRLVDRDGRRNKLSAEIAVNVTRNRPPTIALKLPGRDLRVSPVEELQIQAGIEDDFGVVRQGLNVAFGDQPPFDVAVPTAAGAVKKSTLDHVIDFEALKAAPDQLATYFLWAEDVGPDGSPRRVEGDMYFAEVRHFEEIFRQGEQSASASREQEQQQQGGGAGRQAEQLAELQKQIINGAWKVVRRETGAKPTDELVDDARALEQSQKSALEQANDLGRKLDDAQSKEHLAKAAAAMDQAARLLGQAAADKAPKPLEPALASARTAYQALLKLRAREFEVVRNNARRGRQSGGQAGASRAQRQLNQLELKNDENRFEEQSRAKKVAETQKEQQQRENRQVVSRLRELAQRQADLNDRVKELQSALEAAKDEPARKEIERQLKRLREQQQQILRDADELQEQMENEQNRDRMAEAREQVEKGREHVRQASKALEEGRLSQALTEGSRAGRKLEEVREDLRKQSSNQFADELNEMRRRAKQLDEAQDKATEQLEAWKDRAERSLRDPADRQELTNGLERQREDLGSLIDQMKRTVEDAEETEPILARHLFDAVRKADQQAISEALKETEKLAEFGVPEEAVRSSQRAGQGIGELRERVDQAARGILGDDDAALRLARNEVKDLADQVDREIDQARNADPPEPGRRRPRPDQGDREDRRQDPQGREGQQAQSADRQGRRQGGRQDEQGQPTQQGEQQGRKAQQGAQQDQQGEQVQQGERPGREGRGQGRQGEGRSAGDRLMEGMDRDREQGREGPGGAGGPIRGDGYREWTNRMRDVEELLDEPDLRAEAARIRDRVREAREELKRRSKKPDWNQLKTLVADPLRELHARIAEEVRRRESPDSLVPIDRDPVPPRFAEGVRRYYERLGSGR